jgi:hypothetical protein
MDQTTRLYQIRRTCCEMLADRTYLVADVSGRGGGGEGGLGGVAPPGALRLAG